MKSSTLRSAFALLSVGAVVLQLLPDTASAEKSPDSSATDQVTVTASKMNLSLGEMTQPASVITQDQILTQAHVDMNDVLRQQPGIQLQQGDVPGQFVYPRLRGFSDSTLYVFDGITMNQGGTGDIGYLLGQLDPSMVQRIEILRGPRATLYGANTTSGVIDFTTLTGNRLETDVSAEGGSYDLRKFRAGTQNALAVDGGELTYSLNGSYSDSGGTIKYEFVKNATVVGRTTYKAGDFDFGLSFYGTDNKFQSAALVESIPGGLPYFAVQLPDPGDVDRTKAGIVSLWAQEQISSALSQKLTLGVASEDFSIDYSDYANGGLIGYYTAPYNGWTDPNTYATFNAGDTIPVYQFSQGVYKTVNNNRQADYNLRYRTDMISAVLGASYIAQTYNEGGIYGSLHETQSTRSVYGDASIGWLSNKLHTELGVRLDSYSAWRNKATYSLGAVYDIIKDFSAYANYGTSFTQPTLDQLYNPTYGNNALTPQNGATLEGGFRARQLEGQLDETVTWWHSYVNNVVIYDFTIYNPLAPGNYGKYNNVNAERSQGVEVATNYRITPHWTVSANYTHTDAHVKDATGTWNLMIENARNMGNLGLAYQSAGFDIGGNFYMTSRRLRWAGDVWAPGYGRLDLYARVHATARFDLYARVQNALDHDIVEILGYKNPGVYAVAGASYRF